MKWKPLNKNDMMKIMLKKNLISFLGLILFVFSITFGLALAQVRSTDISINIYPENPGPRQEVRVVVSTLAIDIEKSYITWSVDGESQSMGVGKNSFSFNTGSFTNDISINISIESADGQIVNKTITISPASVDILWESVDGYAPPFYKGKVLGTSEGSLKVVAIPTIESNKGGIVNYKNLSYEWKKEHQSQPMFSGWGKSSFTFKNSYVDDGNDIEVIVSDVGNGVSTTKKIFFTPQKPKILFYEKDPVLGLKMERVLTDDFFIEQDGTTIVAIPYFVHPKNLNRDNLEFNWFISDSQISTPKVKNELGIKPESRNGSSKIKLLIEDPGSFWSAVEKELIVNY